MKVKTSVTLSADLLKAIDALPPPYKNRSEFLETASWAFIRQLLRAERDARDLALINRHAQALNEEALDVLDYQVVP